MMALTNQPSADTSRQAYRGPPEEPADASSPSIPSPPILACATPSLIVSIMGCEGIDCSVAIDIDTVLSFQLCKPYSGLRLFPRS